MKQKKLMTLLAVSCLSLSLQACGRAGKPVSSSCRAETFPADIDDCGCGCGPVS